jgi:hypothetical protein
MKTTVLILFLLSISIISLSQEVLWSRTKKLSFSDFRFPIIEKPQIEGEIAEREYIGNFDYVATSMIGLEYDIDVSCCTYLRYRIFAKFGQFHSYILGNSDTMVLKHEQGHFDICELYGRKMRKFLNENALAKYTRADIMHALDSIHNCRLKYDSLYDKTSFEYTMQIEWSQKILRQIDSLSEYAENEKQIKLK